jgi:translation initiation factor 1
MAEKLVDFALLGALLTDEEKHNIAIERKETAKTKRIGDGRTAIVSLDKKNRRGKIVTLVSGIELPTATLEQLAQDLRKTCGAGGTLKDRVIELQGDHAKKLKDALMKLGFNVK